MHACYPFRKMLVASKSVHGHSLIFSGCARMQISPKEDEVKALQKYSGPLNDLSPPEQFLLVMSSVPRLTDKIHLLMLMHQFEVPSSTLPYYKVDCLCLAE